MAAKRLMSIILLLVASLVVAVSASDETDEDLPKLLKVLGYLMRKANDESFPTQTQNKRMMSPQTDYDDEEPIMTSKRRRPHLSGAMPPMDEFCRWMNVRCH